MGPDPEASSHYALVERAIRHLRQHAQTQPSLEALSSAMGLSPSHLQRVFAQWAGISPKRFMQFLTKEHAKALLVAQRNVLEVSERSGLSSSSRLHDLMVSCEAMTPGEIQAKGEGLNIRHGVALSPFGPAHVAWTPRGVCHLAFLEGTADEAAQALKLSWPQAQLTLDASGAAELMARIFPPPSASSAAPRSLHVLLRGTNFQIKVWEALVNSQPGQLMSYQQLAQAAGCAKAARAVGSAMAANTVAVLIPCHRVIREGGEVGHYRWGVERKLALQAWEAGRGSVNL